MAAKGSVSELVGWVMVLVGALLAVSAGRQVANYFSAGEEWVATEATVVRTRLVKANTRMEAGTVQAASASTATRVYHDVVYFRDGHRYQESVERGLFATAEEAAAAIGRDVRPGRSIEVWVNAADPREVRLQPESRQGGAWSIGLFLLLGLGALQAGTRMVGGTKPSGPALEPTALPAA